jgi:hypothetical protein
MKLPQHRLSACRSSSDRGMALIEALVALAVMAFGLLGVVGMQSTLRFNADVSRQRAEAVRMAQERMETLRAFGVLAGPVTGGRSYADVAATSDTPAPPTGFANTNFSRTVTVADHSAGGGLKMKSVVVEVSWFDRRTATTSTNPERVQLTSTVAAVAPELAATLGLPGDQSAPQRPRGRNAAIPPAAVDQGNGTSSFAPPGGGGVTWTFDNASGKITSVCNPVGTCTSDVGWLLSGYIGFATGGVPTNLEAENPADPVPLTHTVGITVTATTFPTPATSPVCFTQRLTLQVAYFCLVPASVSTATTGTWSGQSLLSIVRNSDSSDRLAPSLSINSTDLFKVCRYTPQATDNPTGGNQAHPLTYTNVNSSLSNQNFLVTEAGDGSTSFPCPADGPDPFINSNTYRHQPIV